MKNKHIPVFYTYQNAKMPRIAHGIILNLG